MRVISLGWGVQSFALAAMSALGELPPVDVAIHADTTHERRETYEFAAKWTPWLEARGVRVVTVKAPNQVVGVVWADNDQAHAAFYTLDSDNKQGQMLRACTDRWKIRPIRQWIRQEVGLSPFVRRVGVDGGIHGWQLPEGAHGSQREGLHAPAQADHPHGRASRPASRAEAPFSLISNPFSLTIS